MAIKAPYPPPPTPLRVPMIDVCRQDTAAAELSLLQQLQRLGARPLLLTAVVRSRIVFRVHRCLYGGLNHSEYYFRVPYYNCSILGPKALF